MTRDITEGCRQVVWNVDAERGAVDLDHPTQPPRVTAVDLLYAVLIHRNDGKTLALTSQVQTATIQGSVECQTLDRGHTARDTSIGIRKFYSEQSKRSTLSCKH